MENLLQQFGNAQYTKILRGFHGTRQQNIEKIAKNGLLKVGNPMNPSAAVDQGYFGDCQKGIYLSCYILLCCP